MHYGGMHMKKLSITTLAILSILAVLGSVVSAELVSDAVADNQRVNAFSTYTLDVSGNFRDDGNDPAATAVSTYSVSLLNNGNAVDCNVDPITCPSITPQGTVIWAPQKDSIGADADNAEPGVDNKYRIEVTARDSSNPQQQAVLTVDVSVDPVLEITNEPPQNLRTDSTSNNGLYDYTVSVLFSGNPANLIYDFRSANPPPVVNRAREGSLLPADLSQGRIIWKPTQAEAGTRDFIVEVRDPRNNAVAAKRFPLTVEGAVLAVEATRIGDANTKRSNPLSSLVADRNRTGAAAVQISNTGDLPVRVGDVTITIAPEDDAKPRAGESYIDPVLKGFRDAQEEARVEALPLAPGASDAVNIVARIVSNLPAVDSVTLLPRAFKIGTVSVVNEETNQVVNAELNMQAENKLEIDQVEVCKGTNDAAEKCEKPKDGDTVDEAKPFDLFTVAVTIENTYNDEDEDPVIEDVFVKIDSTDPDLDVDDDNEETDIDVDENEVFSEAIIQVEDDADGTSNVVVKTFGRDENGAFHGMKQTFKIKVERSSHEVDIFGARLNPALVSCTPGNRNVQVDVDLRNIGKKKEREVKVEARIERSGLNVLKSESDIEMDKDDENRALLSFSVPETVPPGVYAVEVRSFTDRNQLSDTETVTLTVPDCGFVALPTQEEQEEEEPKEQEEVVVTPTTGTTPAAPATGTTATATPVAKKATKTFTASNAYLGALIAIIVVLLIVGGILVAMIARKQ